MSQVTILSQLPGQQRNEAGQLVEVIAVTYASAELPPRVVFVPAAGVNDGIIADAIRKDIEAFRAAPVRTLDI